MTHYTPTIVGESPSMLLIEWVKHPLMWDPPIPTLEWVSHPL